jgi:hypothetical protein
MAGMTAQEAAEQGKNLDFEKVWAMFQETDRRHVENEKLMAQLEKTVNQFHNDLINEKRAGEERLAQLEKNLDRAHNDIISVNRAGDERLAQLEKTVDRVTGNVGGLNRSLGELIETLIAARLWEKFPQYNLTRAYQRIPLYDEKNVIRTDIDILLVNTDMCMAVEVKRELDHRRDVDEHLKRMSLIRQYPPELVNSRQLVGAMAGGVVDPDVKNYAYKSGFFVLELTGESVHLIPPPEGFEPKKW